MLAFKRTISLRVQLWNEVVRHPERKFPRKEVLRLSQNGPGSIRGHRSGYKNTIRIHDHWSKQPSKQRFLSP